MKFVDSCTIVLKAGDGGNGAISWRKEAHYPEGGPWGGDGGKGGDIQIIGDHNEKSLLNLSYKKKIEAKNGENGGSKLCHGKNGSDIVIKVPIGTVIKNAVTNEIIIDVVKQGEIFTICKGGIGGRGNAYFKSSRNKAPKLFENGELGEKLKVVFELRYMADVGLVGLPNAGKSTFINAVSNANSKTADYQFTTLYPVLGVVSYQKEKLVFADIPGIIENASLGEGLGLDFLKHISRCHFLIHLVSVNPYDTNASDKDYLTIKNELKNYGNLLNKKIIVVANKIDNKDYEDNLKKLKKVVDKKVPFFEISALTKKNIDQVLNYIFSEYLKYKKDFEKELNDKLNSYSLVSLKKLSEDVVEFFKDENNVWNVKSKRIEYWYNRIPQTTEDNIIRFCEKIKLDEIEKELIKKGAKKGDTFKIMETEYIVG